MLHGQQETESGNLQLKKAGLSFHFQGQSEMISPLDAPPSFCDMGNAISSLIASEENLVDGGEECVLLSEEHSLVLTCCWVSLKVPTQPRGNLAF